MSRLIHRSRRPNRAADAHRERELVRLHGVRIVRVDAQLVLVRPAVRDDRVLEHLRCFSRPKRRAD